MGRLGVATIILVLSVSLAFADIAPSPPRAPEGPRAATIRGLSVERYFDRWGKYSWVTVIISCASSQPACTAQKLVECTIEAVDGRPLANGDVAAIVAADEAAGPGPLRLNLGRCAIREIELAR